MNLCINARDAMPGGGRLTIETGNVRLDARAARERDLEAGNYVAVSVTDTGTGMTPDVAARAFEPFFTTKPLGLGTGLGLSMIYGFVRQSRGQVRIHSEPGMGTTVRLLLPQDANVQDAGPFGDPVAMPRGGSGETVLVVDDEPSLRMLVREILEELDYVVVEAEDGPSGLKVLQSGMRIDLVISDVGMPGGMNGRQMADAARVDRPGLKVLFITGYAEKTIVGNGHLEKGMHVLTKPFELDALAARISTILGSES